MLQIKPPIVQIALDFATIEEALAMAKIGVEAGVDWLEIGTPLIVSQGLAADRADGAGVSELSRCWPITKRWTPAAKTCIARRRRAATS